MKKWINEDESKKSALNYFQDLYHINIRTIFWTPFIYNNKDNLF